MTNNPSKSKLSPEEKLLHAVYIRARNDLIGKSQQLQQEVALFFAQDGFDPQAIRLAWAGRNKKGM
jgi:hypothetical protein